MWPKKKQWNSWTLPTKWAVIGSVIAILAFCGYVVEKALNISNWAMQDAQNSVVKSNLSLSLQFPLERVDASVKQNKGNPKLTITNTGLKTISPLKADVTMFVLNPSFDEVSYAVGLSYDKTHGRSIFEPELKPGLSVSQSLPGIRDWGKPAAYRIRIEVIIPDDNKLPDLSVLFLIDKEGIKAEGVKLSESIANRINEAILDFEKNEDVKRQFTLNMPLEGVWVLHAEPGVNLKLNEDGTFTVK